MSADVPQLLRGGLLDGLAVVVAGAPEAALVERVGGQAEALGARVATVECGVGANPETGEAAVSEAMTRAVGELGSLRALVVDAGSLFAVDQPGESLIDAPAAAWNAVRAVADQAFVEHGGQIVLIGAPGRAVHSRALSAALENMARTLSIEWARYGITTVAIAPGDTTEEEQLATLACWLLSPAGAYFSGCLMDLRGPGSGRH